MTDKKMTVTEIEAEIERLKAEITTRRATAKSEIRSEIAKMLADEGLTIYDIYPDLAKKKPASAKGKGKSKVISEVKGGYKDPTSGATWSGRGRSPKWVTELCEQKRITLKQFKSDPKFRL